jgi:hypothetical protein
MTFSWRLLTALALLLFAALGLFAGMLMPVLRGGSGSVPLWGVFVFHPVLGVVGALILVALVVLVGINFARLINMDLKAILTRNTPLTPVVAILGLGYGDLEEETTRLNLVLTGFLFVALLVLGILAQMINQDARTADGYGVLLFFVSIPLAAIALACHPTLRAGIAPRMPVLRARVYLEVRHGRLLGAKPQIDLPPLNTPRSSGMTSALPSYGQPGLFHIGRGETNDLVLFDESSREVLEHHACIYFPDLRPTLRAYGPVIINGRPYEQPGDYPLDDKVKFQIGQTVIRFFSEPLS